MEFLETPVFTKQVWDLFSDDEYRELQAHLVQHPDVGAIIQESGGLRKIRWAVKGQGKRGGVRVIYYWVVTQDPGVHDLRVSKDQAVRPFPRSTQDAEKDS